MTKEERYERLRNQIAQCQEILADEISTSSHFEISRLPPAIRDVVQLTIADNPKFSTVSAVANASYSIAHLISQARPYFNDPTYSRDLIPLNAYFINVSGSG